MDEKAPRSLANLLPESLVQLVRKLHESELGYYLSLSEEKLRRQLVMVDQKPNTMDDRIRIQFWLEYDKMMSMDKLPTMDMGRVIGSVMSKESFYRYYIVKPEKLAWMLCPPKDYVELSKSVLTHSLEKINEILEFSHQRKSSGEIDLPFANWVVRVHQMLHNRVLQFDKNAIGLFFQGKPEKGAVPEKPDESPVKEPTKEEIEAMKRAELEELRQMREQ